MKFRIIFVTLTIILFLNIIPAVNAFSIGISPAEKTVEVEEYQQTIVYFIVSQGASAERQSISMNSDADWTIIEPESFELGAFEQEDVKVTVKPLPRGDYTAKITASASIPGMKVSMSATLNVFSVLPSEVEKMMEKSAEDAINRAKDMIIKAREEGGNPIDAETILTSALEEFEKENYDYSMTLSELAYNLALEEYNKAQGKKTFLFPMGTALIFIIIWGCIGIVLTIYELIRALRKKISKPFKTVKGKNCPKCGKPMGKLFDGLIIKEHICSKCGYREVKAK